MEDYSEDTDRVSCSFCGEGNEKGSRFCIHCGKSFPGKKRFRFSNPYVFAGAGLILIGVFAFSWMHNLESSEVGRVNGETISREEFLKRIDRAKKFYEYRYGQDVFQGEAGKNNLNRLKTGTLDEMVTEKILLQEARAAGYTAAPEDEIQSQIEAIKKKNNLAEVELEKIFGGSIDDFKAELRTGWVISQFVDKMVV